MRYLDHMGGNAKEASLENLTNGTRKRLKGERHEPSECCYITVPQRYSLSQALTSRYRPERMILAVISKASRLVMSSGSFLASTSNGPLSSLTILLRYKDSFAAATLTGCKLLLNYWYKRLKLTSRLPMWIGMIFKR
jgi:hypothetical protein